jgi:alkylation response protein AidB-like acyl-CoA dehydrogenase
MGLEPGEGNEPGERGYDDGSAASATVLGNAELADLGDAVRGVLGRSWKSPTESCDDDRAMSVLWSEAVAHGWTQVGPTQGGLRAALLISDILGRFACPAPLFDAYVATEALAEAAPQVIRRIEDGEIVVVIGRAEDGQALYLDGGAVATHVLLLPTDDDNGMVELRKILVSERQAGLAAPDWLAARELGEPEASIEASRPWLRNLLCLHRVGLAARACGAAERTHELALEHAKVRSQFGTTIGKFQAVSHRAATCATELDSAALLFADAARRLDAGEDAAMALELAAHQGLAAGPWVARQSLHTLGGAGYFAEHEASWLWRQSHADAARARAFETAAGGVDHLLFDEGLDLPAITAGEEAEVFRGELREFFAKHWPPERDRGRVLDTDEELVAAVGEAGYFGIGWPPEFGGREAGASEQLVLYEEVHLARAPLGMHLSSADLQGSAILNHGTDAQRHRYLPTLCRGGARFSLGYSEPEAGSDLASLRTRADRVDGGWRINGQKIFTTAANTADYIWLAARTDPSVPSRQGIGLFIVPADSPGITIQQHTGLSGEISCTVFYDDVFVDDEALVGPPTGGWSIIVDALLQERLLLGAHAISLVRSLETMIEAIRDGRVEGAGHGSWQQRKVVDLACKAQSARLLVLESVDILAAGGDPRREGPMAKILAGEMAEELGELALAVLGPGAALAGEEPGSMANGAFEHELRLAPMYVIGGGSNDIQRNLIARELGLPR